MTLINYPKRQIVTVDSFPHNVDKKTGILRCNSSSANQEINLGAAADNWVDHLTVKNLSANRLIIYPAEGETVDGKASLGLPPLGSWVLYPVSGVGWEIE